MVHIREARISDVPSIVNIRVNAFQTPVARWLNSNHPINRLHASMELRSALIAHPDDIHLVACDDAGTVVGSCLGAVQTAEDILRPEPWSLARLEASLSSWETWFMALPTVLRGRQQRAATAERVKVFAETIDASRAANTKTLGKFLYVKLLIVDPACQGHGVGAKLLQHCRNLARQLNVPVYLESSQRGYPFYKKLGFTDFGDPCIISYQGEKLETLPTVLWRGQS